mmetsp:Transcript_23247/g.32721  ORF Transcript_23247/g.32721 Transcript_23247/m.32721 type:complete len:208 (+) Transcript_23247:819-1442(+)
MYLSSLQYKSVVKWPTNTKHIGSMSTSIHCRMSHMSIPTLPLTILGESESESKSNTHTHNTNTYKSTITNTITKRRLHSNFDYSSTPTSISNTTHCLLRCNYYHLCCPTWKHCHHGCVNCILCLLQIHTIWIVCRMACFYSVGTHPTCLYSIPHTRHNDQHIGCRMRWVHCLPFACAHQHTLLFIPIDTNPTIPDPSSPLLHTLFPK